ncbi:MAG: PqqD family peptide modification chaperone [Candidatus Binatus sp.]
MLVSLTRLGISSNAAPAQLRSAREHFQEHDYLRLPGFIEPGFFRVIQRYLLGATWEKRFWNVGHDLTLTNNPLSDVVHVLLNDPKLFRMLGRATGCGPIRCFKGRLYRMVARKGLLFDWHPDTKNNRKLAISINLSDAPYRGGTLEIRERSGSVREVVPNLGFGDAIVFRVAEHLEHRLTPVVGRIPKTAIAGFFCTSPDYASVRREMFARFDSAIANGSVRKRKRLPLPSPNDIVKIPRAVVSQTTGSETFVANIGTAMCYGLNATGGRIWELLAEGREIRSVSAKVARESGAQRRAVEHDVLALAHQLAQRDLVKIVRASGH